MGKTFHIYEYTGQQCTVHPYSSKYKPKIVQIAHGGTAYDHPNGTTYILDINHGFDMSKDQEPSLLNPNQLRSNNLIVDDCPIHLSHQNSSTHSIYATESDVTIPLELDGVISYISTRLPTVEEIRDCEHIVLTSTVEWDPHSSDFVQQEQVVKTNVSRLSAVNANDAIPLSSIFDDQQVTSETDLALHSISSCFDDARFVQVMASSVRVTSATTAKPRKSTRDSDHLSKMWGISNDAADRTLKVTTQRGIRTAIHPIHRRYRTNQQQFRYNRLHTKFYSDTMFSQTRSLHGNTCCQIFVNDVGYSKHVPMKSKSDAGNALETLFMDVGVPTSLVTDGAKELTIGKWKEVRDKHGGIKQNLIEPFSPWQNRAESEIREVKKQVRLIMQRTNANKRLWDYCVEFVSQVRNRTALGLPALNGRTPYEVVTGDTPDISEWIQFSFNQPVWYYEPGDFPEQRRLLGRWIGVAHRVGQALCYWILPISGEPIARTTVQQPTPDELNSKDFQQSLNNFDTKLNQRLARGNNDLLLVPQDPDRNLDQEGLQYEPYEPEALRPEADDYDTEAFDKFLTAEVMLPLGDKMQTAKVLKRKRDDNNNPVGKAHSNPLLDTRVYQVQFPDGTEKEYTANLIAEALYSQTDDEGNQYLLLDEILDHTSDNTALKIDDMYIDNKRNQIRRTTKGWKLLVQWKDGSSTWTPLKDLKESNPVQVAEYAVSNKIASEPAFVWWVKDVLRRRDRIIAKVKSKYWKRTHKFGIQIPKTVNEALQLDKESGTTLWYDAIQKEMKNARPAFRVLQDGERVPVGFQHIKCHMIFDVKMDFTRKARFVAGGHMTSTPASLTYSSVVSRDSARIAFLLAALNNIDILAADIGNAYLNAECREKIYITAGPEFGSDQGKQVIIVRALYGLKSSGAAWRSHLAQSMSDLHFTSCLADPDVWLRPATKANGEAYYEYVLIYVDDLLVTSENPAEIMRTLSQVYRFKEDPKTKETWGPPTRYLGANIGRYQLPSSVSGKSCWYMSADDYISEAIKNVESELEQIGQQLYTARVDCVMSPSYRPELDTTPLLEDQPANYYQNLIGVLRWAVELGRIDIHVAVSLLSQYLAAPREGHLDRVFGIFAYLKKHNRSKVVFDETYIDWGDKFPTVNWNDFYPDVVEPIPSNAPPPRGPEVQVNCFVDADHAGNRVTRRSHTGILIFLNKAPIIWYSKRQNTVETSTFGSEFIALKIATEMLQGLRYKLRMMGVALDGPANVFCDNNSVVTNSTIPESTLKKKHVSICYHRVREACAMEMIRIAYENTKTNLADCLTKNLSGQALKDLITRFLY